jgi:hypothetical protein
MEMDNTFAYCQENEQAGSTFDNSKFKVGFFKSIALTGIVTATLGFPTPVLTFETENGPETLIAVLDEKSSVDSQIGRLQIGSMDIGESSALFAGLESDEQLKKYYSETQLFDPDDLLVE